MDEETFNKLIEEIIDIKDRLNALEKEQRLIREDILAGNPRERIHKRLLNTKYENIIEKKQKINDEAKIEI